MTKAFRAKAAVSAQDLASHAETIADFPRVTGSGGGVAARPPATVQVNFKATEEMARLLAKLAEREGSIRRVVARLLKADGHDVAEADLNPPLTRRWR